MRDELERGLRRRRLLHRNIGGGGGSRQEVMFVRLGVPSLAMPTMPTSPQMGGTKQKEEMENLSS